MDTDLKAEILAQIARLDELIDKSTELVEKTDDLLNQSRRLIRQAKHHNVDRGRKPQPRHGAVKAIESNQQTL